MENFTNETIDTAALPRFETVVFEPLHPDYWKVTLLNFGFLFVVLWGAAGSVLYFNTDLRPFLLQVASILVLISFGMVLFSRTAFKRKGYAFRTHDVLFRSGVIATTTTVVPYNRIQHVALHQGLIARNFGLSEIQIFTAGASGSDIEIPGIPTEKAESIKQLLMGKIKKDL